MCEDQLPLFDAVQTPVAVRPAPSPVVAWGACPLCLGEWVEIVRSPDGRHLSWQVHDLSTGTLPCQASGLHLCDAPARTVPGKDTPFCSH